MSKSENLWEIAINRPATPSEGTDNKQGASDERSVLVVGSKHSGKTSIVLRFLDRDEATKPTTALEYTYARKAKGHNLAKDVGHIWELGGGTWLSKLIEIPINKHSIRSTAYLIVLDLSAPNELWFTLESLLKAGLNQVEQVIQSTRQDQPDLRTRLDDNAWERVGGREHMDKAMMTPFPLPLAILGSKYDVFQNLDPEKRKAICKTLRFVAHSYGASLQFFSTKQEATLNKARSLLSHLVFTTNASKNLQVDLNKPLLVPAGLDSFQQIGSPPLDGEDLGVGDARTPIDLWKKAYTKIFPQENTDNPATVEDPAKDTQYSEPAIDSLRVQKDAELERYRRLCERRANEVQHKTSEGLAF